MLSAWTRAGDCPPLHIDPLHHRRKINCSKGAMTKIGTLLAILAVVGVYTLLVLADSNGQEKKQHKQNNHRIYNNRRRNNRERAENQQNQNFQPTQPSPDQLNQNNQTISHLIARSPQDMEVLNNENRTANNRNSNCSECNEENCAIPSLEGCSTELVLDSCSCCYVCGVAEGNRCFNSTFNLPYNESESGICGPGLSCLLRPDLDLTDDPEALCECRDKRMVCGSDNQTYTSECKLREMAVQKQNLQLESWNPCVAAPWISTPTDNVTAGAGDDVSLSCEVKSFPPSIIYWEFLQETQETSAMPKILPGDDSSIVVLVRGGPDQMMTTSWLQMISVSARNQGKYFCNAKNSEGMTRATAFVFIYKKSSSNLTLTTPSAAVTL